MRATLMVILAVLASVSTDPPQSFAVHEWGLQVLGRAHKAAGWLSFSSDMKWSGQLRTVAPKNMPKLSAEHWWNVARGIPSAYFQAASGSERFLFYEATAAQRPVITSKISDLAIELKSSYHGQALAVKALERRQEGDGYKRHQQLRNHAKREQAGDPPEPGRQAHGRPPLPQHVDRVVHPTETNGLAIG